MMGPESLNVMLNKSFAFYNVILCIKNNRLCIKKRMNFELKMMNFAEDVCIQPAVGAF